MSNAAFLSALQAAEKKSLHRFSVPLTRWIIVGYFFWVGIFLGAVIMHAATAF